MFHPYDALLMVVIVVCFLIFGINIINPWKCITYEFNNWKKEIAMSWKWDDLNYVSENSENKKQYMKKSIALHFTRAIYAYENKIQNY